MTETPSPTALERACQSLENGDVELTVRDTPLGKKVGYTGADNPFSVSSKEFEAFSEVITEYESLLVTLHNIEAVDESESRRLWRIGDAIVDECGKEPTYGFLAAATPFLSIDEHRMQHAVCLAKMFDNPSDVPTANDRNIIERAGEKCVDNDGKHSVKNALTVETTS